MPTTSVYEAVIQSSALPNPADTALLADCISKAAKMVHQTMPEITADVERHMLESYRFGVVFTVRKTKTPGVNRVTASVVYSPQRIKAACTSEVEDPRQQQLIDK